MITCIAIDDEPLALRQMERYIKDTPSLILKGLFESAVSALGFLQSNEIDLMFLDINMPNLNGMEFVKTLATPPKVIFTTAHSEYAIEGFRVDALDYLLKPIGYADFLKSANKAVTYFKKSSASDIALKSEAPFILVKSGHSIIRVNLLDIKYIEGMREYVRIHLVNQKSIMSLISMKRINELLPEDSFMRVHRSYIVRLDKIQMIERNRILLNKEESIPISNQYQPAFQKYLTDNALQ